MFYQETTHVKKSIWIAAAIGLLTAPAPPAQAVPDPKSMDPVVVTATRIGNQEYELTGNVTVIDAETIESSGARTVDEVLRQVPGLYVYDRSTPKTSVVDIRGFGESATTSVLILVNDRKLNSVDLSGPDLLQIPVEAIERIEILRGAGSVLYGDNSVGGVINIITKEGEGDPRWTFVNQTGSHDRYKSSGQVAGKTGNFGYYGYAGYNHEKGYRDRSDVLARDFNTRFTYEIDERLQLDWEIGGHDDETDLPGGLDENEIIGYGRRGSADTNYSETQDVFTRIGADVGLGPDPGDWGSLVVDVTYKDREVFDSFFGTFNSKRDIDQWGVLTKYVFDEELWGRDFDFVVGLDTYDTENRILGSGTNTDDVTISKDEIGVYTFLEAETFDRLYVNFGGRYQEASYEFDDRGAATRTERDADETVGLAGLKYVYAEGSNVFASVQKTFRFLATDEWYSTFGGLNPLLDQQKGMQYEVGVRHAFGRLATLSVVPYWIDIEDEIYFDPSTFSNGNYDQTGRSGVETSVTFDLLKLGEIRNVQKFDLVLGHTYQEAEFLDGLNEGKTIPLVPDHQLMHRAAVRAWENFLFSLQGRWIGERVLGNDLDNNKTRAKGYYVVDARFAYTYKNLEFFIEVNNVFDKRYNTYEIEKNSFFAPNVTRDVYPADERNMNAGLKVTF